LDDTEKDTSVSASAVHAVDGVDHVVPPVPRPEGHRAMGVHSPGRGIRERIKVLHGVADLSRGAENSRA
jgi:hypothetical protein